MYKVLKKERLNENIYLMDVKAERIARSARPGQFIIARIDDKGERVPLTICNYDEHKGTVTIVFQTIGASTEKMASLNVGDSFNDFVGPLGNPSELINEELEEQGYFKKIKTQNVLLMGKNMICHSF